MRNIRSGVKGHGDHIHIDGGDGRTLCGWRYLAEGTFDGHPIYRGTVVPEPFNCAKCRDKLRMRVDTWCRAASYEQIQELAARLQVVT